MEKDLKDKAIKIKGKDYVLVADRVLFFNETYPNGMITTERSTEGEREIFKAVVIPDCENPKRYFTGYSQAIWGDGYINKTSAMENAETSAVGRALAMMGIGVIESIASADEINKATGSNGKEQKNPIFLAQLKKMLKDKGACNKTEALALLGELSGVEYTDFPAEKECSILINKLLIKDGGNGKDK